MNFAGEDHTENGGKIEDGSSKTKQHNKFEKLKRAAVSTVAAAAVKAKLLAKQEEDQIQQLAAMLVEKQVISWPGKFLLSNSFVCSVPLNLTEYFINLQLHKVETKLSFINDMENLVMRVREHLDRSRQRLYHERAMIIASRLGIPPSSSRGVPPSMPANRVHVNSANLVPRPPISMNPQRPPISRPMSTVATALSNPMASATTAGNSVRPSSQEKLSSVGTK